MKLQALALAALFAVAGPSFAQTTTTKPAQPPSKATVKADRDQVKKDQDELTAARKSGDPARIKAAEDKVKADRAKSKADKQARKNATTKNPTTPSTTSK